MTGTRLALGAIILLSVAGTAGAQTAQPIPRSDSARIERRDDRMPEGRRMRQGERMRQGDRMRKRGPNRGELMRELNLTEAQRTQIRAIHERGRERMQALHAQQMAEVRSILTPEQRTRFDAAAAKRKEHMKDHGDMMGKRH